MEKAFKNDTIKTTALEIIGLYNSSFKIDKFYALSPKLECTTAHRTPAVMAFDSLEPGHSLVETATLEVYGGEEQQYAGVVGLLPPQLHAVSLCILVVTSLVLAVCQLQQTYTHSILTMCM